MADDLRLRQACPVMSSLLQSGTGGQRARGAPSKKLQDMARVNEWFICFDNKINEDLQKKNRKVYYLFIFNIRTEKALETHSSTLAWKIPWREEPGRLQSTGSLRVGPD